MAQALNVAQNYRLVARAAWVGIIGNLLLGAAKLAGGILGASQALIADAIDTLGDTLSSLVVLHGAWHARKPADVRHPFGHGKAEVIAARTVAIMLMAIGVVFGYRAVLKVLSPGVEPLPAVYTLWFALASVVVKEGMFQYKMRLARRTGSQSLVVDAWNHRSDALAGVCAIGGIGAAILLGPAWRVLDPIAAVVICAIIFGVGVVSFAKAGAALMDEAADGETLDAIRRAAMTVPGVKDTEKLMTRRSGLETHLELHVEVDPKMTVGEAHGIATRVSEAIRRQVPGTAHVTVHIEPYYPGDH
jgi:cation diffusion facilitator family transporter